MGLELGLGQTLTALLINEVISMYNILQMNWEQIMDSEYLFKCNSQKKVVEIKGVNMSDSLSKDSDIIIFYNLYTGVPYLLVEKTAMRIPIPQVGTVSVPDQFNICFYDLEDEDAVEVVCVHKDIADAIDKLDSDAAAYSQS